MLERKDKKQRDKKRLKNIVMMLLDKKSYDRGELETHLINNGADQRVVKKVIDELLTEGLIIDKS